MEQHDRSHRQYSRQGYSQQQQGARAAQQGQQSIAGSAERFRQSSYAQQPLGSASSVGNAGGDTQQSYGLSSGSQYGTGTAIQSDTIQFGQEIPTSEASRQQSQQYSQYGSNLMYPMSQQQGAATTQPLYEQVSQYRLSSGASTEPLPAQFGMPQFYLAGQTVPGGGTLPEISTATIPSQYSQSDNYPSAGHPSVPDYHASIVESSQTAMYNPYAQQTPYTPQLQIPSDEQAFENYQVQIRNIFTLARDGALSDVGARLLDVSQYLLGNVEALGLTRDDDTLHDGRIRLWDEFNKAWLVCLQRQFDLSQQMLQNNRPLEQNLSIMDAQALERLSTELVRLCDNIEKHGLVDYQMGVAEEEIMELLLRCLALLNGKTTQAPRSNEASTAGASRRG